MRALILFTVWLTAADSLRAQVVSSAGRHPGLHVGVVVGEDGRQPLRDRKILRRIEGAPVEMEDFSVSFFLQIEDLPVGDQPAEFFVLNSAAEPLRFSLSSAGELRATMADHLWKALISPPVAGREVPVALSVNRDARQALAGLWVDGVEVSALGVKPGALKLKAEAGVMGGAGFKGVIADLRVHDRALSREEVLAHALHAHTARPALAPFAEIAEFSADETLAIIGGTEAVALVEDGTLEALLVAKAPHRRPRIRSLAWETDTVWRQDRPLNFGPLAQQISRSEATAILLIFGRQECLERGAAGLADFNQSLETLIALCRAHTPRILMVTPPWFEAGEPPQPDLRPHNAVLKGYQDAILRIATAQGLPAVPPMPEPPPGEPLTTDGANLGPKGLQRFSRHIASFVRPDETAPTAADIPPLLRLIRSKNQLWHHYWRPSNWAFLYGDRTGQPSSRDHLNPEVRWFPAELQEYKALIDAKEREIWQQAAQLERRVP